MNVKDPLDLDVAPNGDAVFAWSTDLGKVQGRRVTAAGALGPILDVSG